MSLKKVEQHDLIVITGAAGFIGSCLVRYLNDRGFTNLVLVDDIGKTEKWKNLLGKKFKDLIAIDQLFHWLKGRERVISAFIHLGACTDTLEEKVDDLLDNNTRYTIGLAEYALQNGQKFIYASSAATYGDGRLGFSDDHALLHDLKPLNAYGFSKHLFDIWALEQGILDRIIGLKYFNVYGPNEYHKGRMASMVCKMVPQIQREGVLRLFKSTEPQKFCDGGQCRDFIYVKDAVAMTAAFLENHGGGIYNIGMGKPSTWNELARALFKAMDLPVNVEYVEMPADLAKQYQNYTCAAMEKFRRDVGPQYSTFSLEDAVRDYVRGYLLTEARW